VKIVLEGARRQGIEDVRKNMVTELIAVPLDTYSDCFVHLLEEYRKHIAVTIYYIEVKSTFFKIIVYMCYVLEY